MDADIFIARYYIYAVMLNLLPICGFFNRHRGKGLDKIGNAAGMAFIQVHDDYKRHSAIRRHALKKLLDGFKRTCRAAYTDYRRRFMMNSTRHL